MRKKQPKFMFLFSAAVSALSASRRSHSSGGLGGAGGKVCTKMHQNAPLWPNVSTTNLDLKRVPVEAQAALSQGAFEQPEFREEHDFLLVHRLPEQPAESA